MRTIEKLFIGFVILAVSLLFAIPAMASGVIKIAQDGPPDPKQSATYLWSVTFKEHVEANGLKVKLYPKDSLGGEAERLDQVRQGLLEMSSSDLAMAGSLDPTIFGFYLPFLFKDVPHYYRVLDNSSLFEKVNTGLNKHGVKLLAINQLGAMAGFVTNKHPIKTPADLKGIRLRALDDKQVKMFEAWGASAVIVPWPEVYNALQTGIADGYTNPPIVPLVFKHNEVLKYFSDVKIMPASRVLICSEEWYRNLDPKEQAIVDEGAVKANTAVREWVLVAEKVHLDALRKSGFQVYTNTPEEQAMFATLARPLYGQIAGEKAAKLFTQAADKNR